MVRAPRTGLHHVCDDGYLGGGGGLMAVLLSLLAVVIVAGLGYWLIVLTEGAYLGPRAVAFLYDWGAPSYDRVKDFDAVDDAWALAVPLVRELRGTRRPLVLDVATGTGRLPLALLRNLEFEGSIVGLDSSFRMLGEASRKAARCQDRAIWLWKDALDLPFDEGTFDAVCCLEALEFMADATQAVKEMARVLRPGGTMLISNRIGMDVLLMPGRVFSKERLQTLLADLSFDEVSVRRWQTYYDLVWARKEGVLSPRDRRWTLAEVVRCPSCAKPALSMQSARCACQSCGVTHGVERGIVRLEVPVGSPGQPESARSRLPRVV
jgi:ubiquinone/menaquinone biosynthesis C-methylase UbiE